MVQPKQEEQTPASGCSEGAAQLLIGEGLAGRCPGASPFTQDIAVA